MARSNYWLWLVLATVTVLFSGHVAQTSGSVVSAPPSIVAPTAISELVVAERARDRGDYEEAIRFVESYIHEQLKSTEPERGVLLAIDLAGELYLRHTADPDRALKFFHSVAQTPDLHDTEMVAVEEWLGAAQDYKRFPHLPEKGRDPDQAYERGTSYFLAGMRQTGDIDDREASALFEHALSWLVPLIYDHPDHEHVPAALLQIAEMRRHATSFEDFWIENFYLKEVIRRFPNTDAASKAFQRLNEAVHAGYSGSSGDHTPQDMKLMLKRFEIMAQPGGST